MLLGIGDELLIGSMATRIFPDKFLRALWVLPLPVSVITILLAEDLEPNI